MFPYWMPTTVLGTLYWFVDWRILYWDIDLLIEGCNSSNNLMKLEMSSSWFYKYWNQASKRWNNLSKVTQLRKWLSSVQTQTVWLHTSDPWMLCQGLSNSFEYSAQWEIISTWWLTTHKQWKYKFHHAWDACWNFHAIPFHTFPISPGLDVLNWDWDMRDPALLEECAIPLYSTMQRPQVVSYSKPQIHKWQSWV